MKPTATGRIAKSDPNLQNIPVRLEHQNAAIRVALLRDDLSVYLADGTTTRCQHRIFEYQAVPRDVTRQCRRAATKGRVFCSQHDVDRRWWK